MPSPPAEERERETRAQRIDPKLRNAGWEVVPFTDASPSRWTQHAVSEFPTENGPADYALFVDGKPLGIIEAKRLTVGPQGVLSQAERYAKGITSSDFDYRGFRVPFLYSTNGEVFWFHDVRHHLSVARAVPGFHLAIPLPAPAEQHEIVRRVDALLKWPRRSRSASPRQRYEPIS